MRPHLYIEINDNDNDGMDDEVSLFFLFLQPNSSPHIVDPLALPKFQPAQIASRSLRVPPIPLLPLPPKFLERESLGRLRRVHFVNCSRRPSPSSRQRDHCLRGSDRVNRSRLVVVVGV